MSVVVCGALVFDERRVEISLTAASLTIALGLFDSVRQVLSALGLPILLFLLGTFLVAGYLEENLFFERIAGTIVRHTRRQPSLLIISLMVAAMACSVLIGEVPAILFVGGTVLRIAQRYKFEAIPFLVMLVFATNVGSSTSPFGPVGVTIAIKAHLGVLDFARWALPISCGVLILVVALCRWWFRWDWVAMELAVRSPDFGDGIQPDNPPKAARQWMLLASMCLLFVFHIELERCLHLPSSAVLLLASIAAGGMALLMSGDRAGVVIRDRVDWRTLLFFLSLFVLVGALQSTGVMDVVADALLRLGTNRPWLVVLLIGWATGLLSALLENMLAVAAFLPVIETVRSRNALCPNAVYWLMLFGATLMGNATSIGSSCNVIACGMAERNGHGLILFRTWLKIGLIVSLASMILATVLLALQTRGLSAGG